ncbi:MAG: tetraacyldisaccharide 4'-kinase [Desulfuromonas sp.]|nr:tetraacyldisaccharide 4'-kinase [Desulfuromonas sp.]
MRTRLALFYRRLASQGAQSAAESLLLAVLVPLGWLYGVINVVRAWLYRRQCLASYRSPVPVISVGNLAVGGTGKTPMVDYLLQGQLHRGRRVAVVSRGYGGEKGVPVRVVCAGNGPLLSAAQCGDEPYLLAMRNPEAIVIVAPRRSVGIQLAVEQYAAEVILLDDGYQHLAVKRDLNLLLFDSRHPLGNGHLLPAGLLREFPSASARADLFILTRYPLGDVGSDSLMSLASLAPFSQPLVRARQHLDDTVRDLQGQSYSLEQLQQGRCVAFAGIANPADFFSGLEGLGIDLQATLALADHCEYTESLLDSIRALAYGSVGADGVDGADFLLTTEKDAVKLQSALFEIPCCSCALVFEPLEPDVLEQFVEALFS